MADDTFKRAMLFDFYGELLTEKQREYFDLHYNEDLSLAEIAEQTGISRQGVWDIIRRAEAVMADVENKTGLIKRFEERSQAVADIQGMLEELRNSSDGRKADLIDGIECKLEKLKG